jgi:hypothetical protein
VTEGGGAGGVAESLVLFRDRRSRPVGLFNGMNAAFMSFQPLTLISGIHAVWSDAGEASVTEVRFRCAPRPVVRRERIKIIL